MTTVFTSRKGQGIRDFMPISEKNTKEKIYLQLKGKVWQLRVVI